MPSSSSSSSQGNCYRRAGELCYCGLVPRLGMSNSEKNPGKKYLSCPQRTPIGGGCTYFRFAVAEPVDKLKEALETRIKTLELELCDANEELNKRDAERAELIAALEKKKKLKKRVRELEMHRNGSSADLGSVVMLLVAVVLVLVAMKMIE